MVNNQQLMVTCPPGVRPGMQVRIMVPTNRQRQQQREQESSSNLASPFGNQMFEVNVPQGVRPGQAFALIANGQRVMVTCPQNARPGQKIRFQLPIKLSADEIKSITLNYEKDGWTRCLGTDRACNKAKRGARFVAKTLPHSRTPLRSPQSPSTGSGRWSRRARYVASRSPRRAASVGAPPPLTSPPSQKSAPARTPKRSI